MSFQRVPITIVDVRLNDASDESYAEFMVALDQIGASFDAPLPAIDTVIGEDEIDRALRNAKDEAEFDAIYAYSGRPVAESWEKRAKQVLKSVVREQKVEAEWRARREADLARWRPLDKEDE